MKITVLNLIMKGLTGVIFSSLIALNSGTINAQSLPKVAQIPGSDQDEKTNIKVYELASPTVVSIESNKTNGSGIIIRSDGLVLTNAHVVRSGGIVSVTLADGRRKDAEVIGFSNEGVDLALIKIKNIENLPTISLGQSGSLKVGQRAYAIGNPFGRFQGTFTVGIISRIDKQKGLIQTDAAINPGNSGGPLLNGSSELIGINTSIFTRSQGGGNIGINFAISIDKITTFLQEFREGRMARTPPQGSRVLGNVKPTPIILNGTRIQEQLSSNSPVLPDQSYYHLYSFAGKGGQEVIIEMKSDEFDPYLILLGPNQREISQNDDEGGGKNARIVITLPVDGTYTIVANSYEAKEEGNYQLELKTLQNHPATHVLLKEEGVLVEGSGVSVLPSDGSLYRAYPFEGKAGQVLTLTLESSDFDPYLVIFAPNGKLLGENDDENETSNNAFLRVTLPVSGRYRIIVNASDSSGRGRYVLTVR